MFNYVVSDEFFLDPKDLGGTSKEEPKTDEGRTVQYVTHFIIHDPTTPIARASSHSRRSLRNGFIAKPSEICLPCFTRPLLPIDTKYDSKALITYLSRNGISLFEITEQYITTNKT